VLGVPVLSMYAERRQGFLVGHADRHVDLARVVRGCSATLTCLEGFSLTSCASLLIAPVFGDAPSFREGRPAAPFFSLKKWLPSTLTCAGGPRHAQAHLPGANILLGDGDAHRVVAAPGVGVLQRFQGALYVAEVAVLSGKRRENLVHLALREQGISLDDVALDVERAGAGGWVGTA